MHELTLKLLRSLKKENCTEEYATFYIHDMNKIIEEYLDFGNVPNFSD